MKLTIIISVALCVILAAGLLLKRRTRRKLNEIDGVQGVVKQTDIGEGDHVIVL